MAREFPDPYRRIGGYMTDLQKLTNIQLGEHFLEQFSLPTFRLHATVCILARDRTQFHKLTAIVIAFSRLSPHDGGTLHDPHGGTLSKDHGGSSAHNLNRGVVPVREGRRLKFGGDEETGPFALAYGEVIHNESSLAGRSTTVPHATSLKWERVGAYVYEPKVFVTMVLIIIFAGGFGVVWYANYSDFPLCPGSLEVSPVD